MKRTIITFLILLTAIASGFAIDPEEAVRGFVASSGIKSGSIAVKIADLKDNKILGKHNATTPLVPASIMKAVTTAALLGETGTDYNFLTQVYIDGPVNMGVLRGNLVVEGACDPSLNSREVPYSTDIIDEIVHALMSMGVNRIDGEIIIDESGFAGASRPSSWQQADFAQNYGTGSHALNFENNSIGKRSVENPASVFKNKLVSHLRRMNIEVDAQKYNGGDRTPIMTHVSAPVDEIMRSCMMRSDNLFAESMLRTFGKLKGGDGSTPDAATRETEMWKSRKMPLKNVRIIDGSGLSRENRVTADFMTDVLASMSGDPYYASFFPLAGQEGTLKNFLKDTPLDGYVAMKTGSMKGIQCYAGYKLDDDYVPTHTIVIIMNDITGSRDKARKAAEKMLLEIFAADEDLDDFETINTQEDE